MDEEIAIINKNTRNERIKNFILKNKKSIISFIVIIIIFLISFFAYNEYKDKKKTEISDKYNSLIIDYSEKNKELTKNGLIELINKKDSTYSPLSLYFIIDNLLITEKSKVNEFFNSSSSCWRKISARDLVYQGPEFFLAGTYGRYY